MTGLRDYNCATQECAVSADAVAKQLFEHLVGDEEGHAAHQHAESAQLTDTSSTVRISTVPSEPSPDECPDKHGLIEDIRLAMRTVIGLNNQEMEAVMSGDFAKIPAIKGELVEARKWKDALLEAFYDHVREHGC